MPKVTLRKQEWGVPVGITIRDAIRKIGQEPEALLALIDNQLVHEETILKEGDTVKLVAVISGGQID